jgi:spore cortex formation protein SpoVR/YcgB (stage V sporulation)
MSIMSTEHNLPADLRELQVEIQGHARDYGLDFYETIFEVLDYDELSEIAALGGFPTRYPHWRFGMEYEQLSKGYRYGLQKIYEMVINNDPCYAYLLRCNQRVDQKLVMAHVYGHNDFFKNNIWFSLTNRKMMDETANHGNRIRSYMERFGEETVESFIDSCLSLENLIDMHSPFIKRRDEADRYDFKHEEDEPNSGMIKFQSKDYMDSYVNPPAVLKEQARKKDAEKQKARQLPEQPERDVLLFLLENAPLNVWQRDVLDIIRQEAYYFTPQGQTRRKWDKGLGLGRQKIFEVRRIHNDVTFIDTFLTPEFCRRYKMFSYKHNDQNEIYEIESREFKKIKERLLFGITNFGQPIIRVKEGNYRNRGELYLQHEHFGIDLKLDHAQDTLRHLNRLWGRPVHIETSVDGRSTLLSFDGTDQTIRPLGGTSHEPSEPKDRRRG